MDRSARLVGILGLLFIFMYAVTIGGLLVIAGSALVKNKKSKTEKEAKKE